MPLIYSYLMDWKEKLNQLKDSLPQDNSEPTENELPEKKVQTEPLRVQMEKCNGKPVTIVSEFEGNEKELKELAKTLKVSCSAGGTAEHGMVLIQGDFRVKIAEILQKMGYKVKKINFK